MHRTIEETPERIRESLEEVVAKAQRLLAGLRSEGDGHYPDAADQLERGLDEAREDAGGYGQKMLQRARFASRSAGDMVYEHPWRTTLVGLAIGALIAIALTARR